MTKEEIAAMIAAKIEGQGTNVDAGSALPAILNGILELIPDAPIQANLRETDPTAPDYIKGVFHCTTSQRTKLSSDEWALISSSAFIISPEGEVWPYIQMDTHIYTIVQDVFGYETPLALFGQIRVNPNAEPEEALDAFEGYVVFEQSNERFIVYQAV